MAVVRPFRAFRPPAQHAEQVASLPYDVMNVAEAREMAAGNEWSFLHVTRPEIDLPDATDPYADEVYELGRDHLARLIDQGALVPDARETFSVYRQQMGQHVQTGIVALASVADYDADVIAKHELTRPDKERDRVRHIDALSAQDEPVFLLSPPSPDVEKVIVDVTARDPEVAFTTDDGISHTLWIVSDSAEVARLTAAFAEMPRLYVADGHHRSAAASRVREQRDARGLGGPGWHGHDGFLAVIFAADELAILPYHRAVRDLGVLTPEQLLRGLLDAFEVVQVPGPPDPQRHVLGMVLDGDWYRLTVREGTVDETDAVRRLDVSVLQDLVLAPLLGITDPRTDPRLAFVGGVRGTGELERLVVSGEAEVAFSLSATSVADLIALADTGRIMPPKSTWFEPKLRSGLFVHMLDA